MEAERNAEIKTPTLILEDLRDVFPSRNEFDFDSGIKVSSNFDGGNLLNCS